MRRQLHISNSNELIPKVAAVENFGPMHKPKFGFWTSSLRSDGISDWVRWCRAEDWGNGVDGTANWFVLSVRRGARVYIIDGLADLKRLHDGYCANSLHGSIDFKRLSLDFEGVRLTEDGQWKTRNTIPGLYGWDAESTLWFRWCFTKVERTKPLFTGPDPAREPRTTSGEVVEATGSGPTRLESE